jgi:hypothetical protein
MNAERPLQLETGAFAAVTCSNCEAGKFGTGSGEVGIGPGHKLRKRPAPFEAGQAPVMYERLEV